MKKLIYLTLVLFIFSGCEKNEQQKLVDFIDGSYKIESITISKSDLVTDSITLINAGEFVFENCKRQSENTQNRFCPGCYVYNNESKINFDYFLEDSFNIQLKQNNLSLISNQTLLLFGNYRIGTFTNTSITLTSLKFDDTANLKKNNFKVIIQLVKK